MLAYTKRSALFSFASTAVGVIFCGRTSTLLIPNNSSSHHHNFSSSSSSSSEPTNYIFSESRLLLRLSSSALTRYSTHFHFMAQSPSIRDAESGVNLNYAEIVVVRHGETEWNADGRIQGHLDVALNDMGRQQAAALSDRLSRERKISVVYSSDLKRALDTAETIARSCGGVEVIKDSTLRERHLGDLQGLVYRELAQRAPVAYEALTSNQTDREIPGGGESIDQLYDRCTSFLQNTGEKHKGERVVVVTHGGVIRSLHRRASPHRRPGKILNASVNIFRLLDGDEWVIKVWGDTSHLDQTGFLQSGFGGDKNSG